MSSLLSLCRQPFTKLGSLCRSKPQPASNEAFLRTVKSIVKRGEPSSLAIAQLRNIANQSFHLGDAMKADFPDHKVVDFHQGGLRQLQLQLCASHPEVDWMEDGACRNLLNNELCKLGIELDTVTRHWEGKLRAALAAGDDFREMTARALLGEGHVLPKLSPPLPRVSSPLPVTADVVHWSNLCQMTPREASLLMVNKATQAVTTETWQEVALLPPPQRTGPLPRNS